MIFSLLGKNAFKHGQNKTSASSVNTTHWHQVDGPNGGILKLCCHEIVHSMTAASTNTVSTTAIPDGACVLAMTGRVIEASTAHNTRTGITFSYGSTNVATLALTSNALVLGSTFSPTTTSATAPIQVAADSDITLTPSGGSGDFVASGKIRFQIWYILATAPTK